MKLQTLILPSLLLTFATTSCKPKADAENAGTDTAASQGANLDQFLLSEKPENAVNVAEVFASPTPGEEVVLTGKVMGRHEPFVANRAMLVLGDTTTLTPCNETPGDECSTPWDVCCDDPDVISQSVATIQIVDEEGRPMKQGLKGLGGIEELTTLTVVGSIAEGSNASNLLINASGIYVAAN